MVIKQVRQWMKVRASAAQWKPIAEWAAKRGATFEIDAEGEGFTIEDAKHPMGRLLIEWGEPQRDYLHTPELRLRLDLKLQSDLQVMVIERTLMDQLEVQVFEAYTDTLQTRIDADTPEEMRWLVMFPKVDVWPSKVARQRFGVCGATKDLAQAWVSGALSEALALASQDLVPAGHPFVMLTQRGNLYLRSGMAAPALEQVQALVRVAEVAARDAQSLNARFGESGSWAVPDSTPWNPSAAPPTTTL